MFKELNSIYKSQRGVIAPTLILLAVVGMLAFFAISNTFNFKDKLFSVLFPKPTSHAANPVTVVTAGNLTLSTTFNSIGVELKNNLAPSAKLQYRIVGDPNTPWKDALPLWQAGGALYGSVVLAEPGTSYEVRVNDPNSTDPTNPIVWASGTITTRAENIPTAASLTPTHFVSASGNDANPGTATAPWKTLGKAAAAAPAGAIVQVGPGSYTARNADNTDKLQFTKPITLVAQFSALDDSRNEINPGQHSVIESGNFTSPGQNQWASHPVAGCTFYQWNSGVNDTFNLGYASTRSELPKRIAKWDRKGAANTTVDNFLNLMCTNKTYNYGFITDGPTIYARLPQDLNPNTVYVSTNTGLVNLHGPNIRMSGFELRQASFETDAAATFAILDHNLIGMGNFYMPAGRDGQTDPATLYYGGDHLVQYNKVMEYGTWSDDPLNKAINWNFVKQFVVLDWQKNPDGSYKLDTNGNKIPINYDANRLGANSEGSGLMGGSGGAKRVVLRYNTLDGAFNGVTYYNADYDKYATQDQDIHDNIIKHIADDAFEPENFAINWRIWNNRVENAGVILSTGPVKYGPIYLFRNQGFRNGYYEGSEGLGSLFFKYSGSSTPMARVYVINNTFWSDNNSDGANQFAGGGPASESFYLRNNIMHSQRYAFKPPTYNTLQWDETNNYISSTGTPAAGCARASCGLEAYGTFTTDVAGYRTAYQTGTGGRTTNTNIGWNSATGVGNFNYNPGVWFTNVLAGDLSLKSTSPFIDAGVKIANIADCFAGTNPDLGAIELGTPSGCTITPPPPTPGSPPPAITPPSTNPLSSLPPTTSPSPISVSSGTTGYNGLVANYYNGNWWDSQVALTRTDANVDFNWESDSPAAGVVNPDSFSATWTGYIEAPVTGTYTFYGNADDGMNLLINNQKIFERLLSGSGELSGTINLTAGQKYPIFVGFIEGNVGAYVNLSWSSPSLTKQIIPTTNLFTSLLAPTPSALVTPYKGDITSITGGTPDGKVDIYDYNELIQEFGSTGATLKADLTNNTGTGKDNKVDIYDYNLLLQDFGKRMP